MRGAPSDRAPEWRGRTKRRRDWSAAIWLIAVVVSGPRPARGGSTTIRSGLADLAWLLRKESVSAVTLRPAVPARFWVSAWVAVGADSTAITSSKCFRQLPRKQSDAGKQIPGQLAGVISDNTVNESVNQPAIHLKECAVIDAVVEAGGVVAESIPLPSAQSAAAFLQNPHR